MRIRPEFLGVGVAFLAIGIATNRTFLAVGLVFIILGLVTGRRLDKQPDGTPPDSSQTDGKPS